MIPVEEGKWALSLKVGACKLSAKRADDGMKKSRYSGHGKLSASFNLAQRVTRIAKLSNKIRTNGRHFSEPISQGTRETQKAALESHPWYTDNRIKDLPSA